MIRIADLHKFINQEIYIKDEDGEYIECGTLQDVSYDKNNDATITICGFLTEAVTMKFEGWEVITLDTDEEFAANDDVMDYDIDVKIDEMLGK
jgi:hypothetical protein